MSPWLKLVGSCTVLSLVLVTGCAEVVTYSKDSRREGIQQYNREAWADAAGAFRNAVRQNPRDYQSYYYLGASQEKLRQFQQANASYRTCLEIMATTTEGKNDPEFRVRAMDGLASAIAMGDSRDVEVNEIEQRVRQHSRPADHYLLARVFALRGDPDSAIAAFDKATQLEPQNFHYAKQFGLYLESIGQTNRATAMLRRAYALENEDQQVYAALQRLGVAVVRPGGEAMPTQPGAASSSVRD